MSTTTTPLIKAKLRWYVSRYGNLTIDQALAKANEAKATSEKLKPTSDEYMAAKSQEIAYRAFADLLREDKENHS